MSTQLSEWLSPINQQITSAGEDVGKGNSHTPLVAFKLV